MNIHTEYTDDGQMWFVATNDDQTIAAQGKTRDEAESAFQRIRHTLTEMIANPSPQPAKRPEVANSKPLEIDGFKKTP